MMNWTAQRTDLLRTMWTEGKSSTQISEALGGVSRNAVMGKVDRMGLMKSALHNMRMPRVPFGACRTAMLGIVRGPKNRVSSSVDATVEDVVPVPAFFVSDIERAVSTAPLEPSIPETGASVDVLDPPTLEMAVIAPAPPTLPDEPVPVVEEPIVAPEPMRSNGPTSRLMRASRSWRGSGASSAPIEPASFSIPPKGLMGRVRAAAGSVGEVDAGVAVSFVKEMGGGIYDATRRAHQAALVAIATVLARGDPRRILVPFMPEPHVLQMMRGLAEKAIVVGGKPPERWADDDTGDRAFFDDVISVEGPLRMDVLGCRRAA